MKSERTKKERPFYPEGKVFSSPFYIGVRHGGTVSRVGINHPVVQELTQNVLHAILSSPFFPTPYGKYSSAYGFSGYYNPFSLYHKNMY